MLAASWYGGKQKVVVDDGDALKTTAAWFNPKNKRWETPQPWDPYFRSLNPEVKQIARGLVSEVGSSR